MIDQASVLPAVGFPPIAAADARLLILGTLPSPQSLRAGRYYAHPRNAFWPIIATLCALPAEADDAQRKSALLARRIALWDVCRCAVRPGSGDAAIVADTVIANDFDTFFATHTGIERLLFNGQPAARLWRRHVWPKLASRWQTLPSTVLPSTSPAHAGISQAEKMARWLAALAVTET